MSLAASDASARFCGDDVNGQRVACACGDVVVSDTILRATDPIVSGRCALDGLIVRAGRLAESITIDLGGHALVGSKNGVGLRIDAGGSDGAVIVGGPKSATAEIVGFGTGVMSTNLSALRRIERVTVKASRHHGFDLRAAGAFLVDVRSEKNGRDGIVLSGSGGRLIRVEARENGASGLRLLSNGTSVDAVATGNGRHGIVSDGRANDLGRSVARENAGVGIVLRGGRSLANNVTAERNHIADVRGGKAGASR